MKHERKVLAAALIGLFALNLALNAVFLLPGESPYRDSIEAGYASMARWVATEPNPWGWKPVQYCGLPTLFAYLPLVPYLTAFWLRLLPNLEVVHVYRVVTTVLACLGPVTAFWFVRAFTKRTGWALLTALAYTFVSPIYALIPSLRYDLGLTYLPWRWHVQAKYGEGPHNVGLMLLPLALVALWKAATTRKPRHLLAASILMAAIALTNWVSAMALAWCALMLILSNIGARRISGFSFRRVFGAALLAYLLAAFWLTPGYIGAVAMNWPKDAFNFKLFFTQKLLLVALALGAVLVRLIFARLPGHGYRCFLTLCFFGFSFVTLAHYWFGVDAIPESRRYLPEAELFGFLLFFELLRRLWQVDRLLPKVAVVWVLMLVVMGGWSQAKLYATRPWKALQPYPTEQTVEYRVASFLAQQQPQGRLFVTGGTRFRMNAWYDLPITDGTFESGLTNRTPLHFGYQIRTGLGNPPEREGQTAIMQLIAMGAEYVAVHGPESQEHYRDFRNPLKFEGLLERVYHSGGDSVYRLPFTSYAHLLRPEEMPALFPGGWQVEMLQPYIAAIQDTNRPQLATRWKQASRLEIAGAIPEGMGVSVRVSYDPGWVAYQDGTPIPIQRGIMGFMLLQPKPSADSRIEMRYEGRAEFKVLAAVSVLAWLGVLVSPFWRRRRRV